MKMVKRNSHYIALLIAVAAVCGSLFFSEILHFPPCVLCWYQRICMYPIVGLLAMGIYFRDKYIYRYVLFLAGIGLLISIYHNLLYYKILPESIAPCTAGVSCTTKFIEYFGFVTIPFLSGTAFAFVIIFMLLYRLSITRQGNKK
ncbi:disulfide oxidoreductase [soil metagenome]